MTLNSIELEGGGEIPKSTNKIIFHGFRRAHEFSGAVVNERVHVENTASFVYRQP